MNLANAEAVRQLCVTFRSSTCAAWLKILTSPAPAFFTLVNIIASNSLGAKGAEATVLEPRNSEVAYSTLLRHGPLLVLIRPR